MKNGITEDGEWIITAVGVIRYSKLDRCVYRDSMTEREWALMKSGLIKLQTHFDIRNNKPAKALIKLGRFYLTI